MLVAEFEEKQFGMAATLELAAGSKRVFPSGQVLEAVLGYDVALAPGDSRVWQLLDAGLPPGAVLEPCLWSGSSVQPATSELPASL
jgi:hypothetical protein